MNGYQRAIIIGKILGDGYLHCSKYGTANLELKHSDKQKEYIDWLYQNLKDLCTNKPRQRKDNGQWYVRTKYSRDLLDLHQGFYRNRRKIIPKNIKEILTSPLSLAVLFMDDGTLDYREKDHCSFYIATNAFSVKDCQKLIEALKTNFGIVATTYNNLIRGKRYPRIYIGLSGREKFNKTIAPYILKCFKYKLPQYRTPQRLDHNMVK